MTTPSNYRRSPFPNRPWISGGLYDQYSRNSVLHLDAYIVVTREGLNVLIMDWVEGGRKRVALDAYLIEASGLTPLWDAERHASGTRTYWTAGNDAWVAPIHARVIMEAERARVSGRWSRVALQAHYVRVRETDCEIQRNGYVSPKRNGLADLL